MVQDFVFPETRPKGDLQIVAQVGAVNLRLAFATGVVQGNLDSVDGDFNGIEDPSSIIGRPDDIFAVHRAANAFNEVGTASASTPAESPEQ